MTAEFHKYYVADHGHHPCSVGAFTVTSGAAHVNFGALRHLKDIAQRHVELYGCTDLIPFGELEEFFATAL